MLADLFHARRMFGGGQHEAWPFAAVAMHFQKGFAERLGRAVACSEAVIGALRAEPRLAVERVVNGSNLFYLRVAGVEMRRPQLARLVLFLPAFWLLVPGSLGLMGVMELAAGRQSATDVALSVLGVAIAIALGLLVGSSLGRSLRGRLAVDLAPA